MEYMAHADAIGDDPTVLGAISAPVLVVQGSETKVSGRDQRTARGWQRPERRIEVIPGAGHAVPLTHPGAR